MFNFTGLLDALGIYEHFPITHVLLFILLATLPAYHFFLSTTKSSPLSQDDEEDVVSSGGFLPFLRELHAKQGDIVSSKLSLENTISVVDPAIIKATLSIGDRPKDLFKFLEPLIGEDNFQVFDTERAAGFKRLVSSAFGQDVLAAKYEGMRSVGVDLINRWEGMVGSQDGAVIKMQEQCLEFSLRVTAKALLSVDVPKDLDFKAFQKNYDTTLGGLFDKQFGVLDDLHEEEFQGAITAFCDTLKKLIDERKSVIIERKENEADDDVRDFLDILLSEKDPETGMPYSDEMIRNFVNGYLTAGYHTTGVAIPWTIFSLTQHPDIQTKLQEEIDRCLQGRLPTLDDLSNMNYLTQVVKESLRVHPPGSFCARLIKSPTSLPTSTDPSKEFLVAPGTTIIFPIPLYHENSNHFVNPLDFDPSRFSQENSKNIKPNTWCPFGFGARHCPGDRLAMVDIKMMVCMIMQKFRVELSMRIEDVVKEEKFVVMAKNDILCQIVATENSPATMMLLSLKLQSRRFRSFFISRHYSSQNDDNPEIGEDCLPTSPRWSVNSLLSPNSKSRGEKVSTEITEEVFKNLLKLSNLKLSTPDEQTKLINDINTLCNFVSHIKDVDVSGVKPLRNLWPEGVGIELRDDEGLKREEIKSSDGVEKGRDLLKHAKVLYGDFYIVNSKGGGNQ